LFRDITSSIMLMQVTRKEFLMKDIQQYPFEIQPISDEGGGGNLIFFPDFSECISDGESLEEAIQKGRDALAETIAALESIGKPVPEPGSSEDCCI